MLVYRFSRPHKNLMGNRRAKKSTSADQRDPSADALLLLSYLFIQIFYSKLIPVI